MKKHYVFIESGATIRFDFSKIFDSNQYSLYLIIEENLFKTLSTGAVFAFQKIIKLSSFQFNVTELEKSLREIISQYHINLEDFSINTHDEYSLLNCAQLRAKFQIQGDKPEDIEHFIDKIKMKKKAGQLKQPRYLKFDYNRCKEDIVSYASTIMQALPFPIFAKPTNMASCFNVSEIHNEIQLMDWLGKRVPNESFELDEFVNADLYHCDSIIQNGVIKYVFPYKYSAPNAAFLRGEPIGSLPIQAEDTRYETVIRYNLQVIEIMSPPTNVVTHLEFFMDDKQNITFLEIAARAPGYEIPYIVEKMSYYNLEEVFVKIQMGLDFYFDFSNKGLFASYMRYPRMQGSVKELLQPDIKSKYSLIHLFKKDDILTPSQNQSELAAIIVFWNQSYTVLREDFYKLTSFKPYIYCS